MGELNNNGFVMFSRDILDDPMYLSERFTRMQAYFDLCYLATYKERELRIRGNKVTLQRGQVAKSVRDLAQRWQWAVNTVIKFIKELEEDGYIETQRTSVNQIITIKKYLMYNTQNETLNDTQIETQNDTKNDTPIININKVINKETTIVAKKGQLSLEQEKACFRETIAPFVEKYGPNMCNDFFEYWTEPTQNGKKMRYQLEKTWEIGRRLARWNHNQKQS